MEAVAREMGFRHYALIQHDDLRARRRDCIDLKLRSRIVWLASTAIAGTNIRGRALPRMPSCDAVRHPTHFD